MNVNPTSEDMKPHIIIITEAIFDDVGVDTETYTQKQKNNGTFLWMVVLQ